LNRQKLSSRIARTQISVEKAQKTLKFKSKFEKFASNFAGGFLGGMGKMNATPIALICARPMFIRDIRVEFGSTT
jgi:hypothetical protein